MSHSSDHTAIDEHVRDVIASRFGIYYPENRLAELAKKLEPAIKKAGFSKISDFSAALLANSLKEIQAQEIIQTLTVGETYFFRELEAIEALSRTIIPALKRDGNRQLRIWSAGCASGEEPYTIAMHLLSTQKNLEQQNLFIHATDINMTFLDKARKAVYSPWSFRTTPQLYRSLYFRDIGENSAELKSAVRSMVTFSQLNLADDSYLIDSNKMHSFDVIFCRNVLMYFEPDIMRTIIRRLAQSLVPGGWLVVSQTECCEYFNADFDAVPCGGITVYRRKIPGGDTVTSMEPHKALHRKKTTAAIIPAPPETIRDMPQLASISEQMPRHQAVGPPATDDRTAGLAELLLEARQLADSGRLEEACSQCEAMIALDNLNSQVYMLYAAILQGQQKFDEARSVLRKVLYLKPDFVMGYYTLGITEQKLGNRREALRNFDTAAQLLAGHQDSDILPELEGLTAGRLKEFLALARSKN